MLLQTIVKRAERFTMDFPEIPIDLHKIASSQKIQIRYEELPEEVSGFITLKDSNLYIVVNKEHPENRQRFTLAHELGHFCLGHMDSEAILIDQKSEQFKLYRTGGQNSAQKELEREANIFAANLLMPALPINQFINKGDFDSKPLDEVIQNLASEFEVSTVAMRYRLINLNIIDETMMLNI